MQKKHGAFVFERVCRGSGKIYFALSVDKAFRNCKVSAKSCAIGGQEVPTRVIPWNDSGRYLLILPALSSVQFCTLEATSDSGQTVASVKRRINPFEMHVRSGLNGVVGNADVQLIRNYDEYKDDGGLKIQIDRIIKTVRPGKTVHGSIALSGPLRAAFEGGGTIQILDDRGNTAIDEDLVIMRDSTFEHPEYEKALIRSIQFSAHVRDDVKSLVIWPVSDGCAAGGPFGVIEKRAFSGLVDFWQRMMVPGIGDEPYRLWFRCQHAAKKSTLDMQAKKRFDIEPTFSIVVPLFHTPAAFFDEMVESVLNQSYGKFELILVNSTPQDADLADRVRELASTEKRVTVVTLEENLGITENTNAGIAAATGDFLCFLDHDDVIEPDALFCYVRAINRYPETDLLYSDEDKYRDGKYIIPFFKPDWDPELITGINYVCHFLCVRKSVVDELEPAGREYDGAQDYHMILRVAEKARNVFHERRVLYHWRIHEGSTAADMEAKPYAIEAGRKAVQAHIDRCGISGVVTEHPVLSSQYEMRFKLKTNPLVSIVIPTKDQRDVLARCVDSILNKTTYQHFEIIIIENNSNKEETFDYYEELQKRDERIRVVLFEGAFNFSKINNYGVKQAKGDYIVFLNNDTEVIAEEWLERMLGVCQLDNVGAVGAKLLYPDGLIQHAGVLMLSIGPCHANQFYDSENIGYFGTTIFRHDLNVVTAACMMTTRKAFESVGGMDERFAVDYNDVDYCLSLRNAGYRVVYEPAATLYHYESVSRGFHPSVNSEISFELAKGLLREKWPKYYALPDSYGNPNFNQQNAYYQGEGHFE